MVPVAAHGGELGEVVVGVPDVDALVLGPAHYVLPVVTERRLDLTRHVHVTCSKQYALYYFNLKVSIHTAIKHSTAGVWTIQNISSLARYSIYRITGSRYIEPNILKLFI